MKKKLIIVGIVLLIIFTGCTKKEEQTDKTKKSTKSDNTEIIELLDEKRGFNVTFTYSKGEKFEDILYYDEGASKEITFKNEELDLNFQMYYTSMTIESYENSENVRSSQKYYKKYKFGKYEAYGYSNYDSSLNLNILLKKNENKMVDVLFVSMERIDTNEEVIVANVVNDTKLQQFYNSIQFNQVKE